jgi:hypothetical protein
MLFWNSKLREYNETWHILAAGTNVPEHYRKKAAAWFFKPDFNY